jgi:hypothetical protein
VVVLAVTADQHPHRHNATVMTGVPGVVAVVTRLLVLLGPMSLDRVTREVAGLLRLTTQAVAVVVRVLLVEA